MSRAVKFMKRADGIESKPTGILFDNKGSLWYLAQAPNTQKMEVWRISWSDPFKNTPPTIGVASASTTVGWPPFKVAFMGAATDFDSASPTLTWYFGDGTLPAVGSFVSHTYSTAGVFNAQMEASDSSGNVVRSTVITITSGSKPEVKITTPTSGNLFQAGKVVSYRGSAADITDGDLSSNLVWAVEFLHDDHAHPYGEEGALIGKEGSFRIPTSGHSFEGNTGFRVVATSTNSIGLSASASVEIRPEHTSVVFQVVGMPETNDVAYSGGSLLAGSESGVHVAARAILSLDSSTDHEMPFELESVPHFQHTVSVPGVVCVPRVGRLPGIMYRFAEWSSEARSEGLEEILGSIANTSTCIHNKAAATTTYTVPNVPSTLTALYATDGSMCNTPLPYMESLVLGMQAGDIKFGAVATTPSRSSASKFTGGMAIFAALSLNPESSTNIIHFGKCPGNDGAAAAVQLRTVRNVLHFNFYCGVISIYDTPLTVGVKVPSMGARKSPTLNSSPLSSTWIVVGIVMNPDAKVAQFFVNNQLVDSRLLSAQVVEAVSGTAMSSSAFVGPTVNDDGSGLGLREVAVYNRALSTSERDVVDEYMFNNLFSAAARALPATAAATTAAAGSQDIAAETTACVDVSAGDSDLLRCPNTGETISSIQFASVGNPNGSCKINVSSSSSSASSASFDIDPAYHIATSFARVGMQCVGKRECILSATAAMFPLDELPELPAISRFGFLGHGCCRTFGGGVGTFTIQKLDLDACERACIATPSCVGYERMGDTCELHSAELTHVAPVQGCQCFVKTGSEEQERPPMRVAVQAKCTNYDREQALKPGPEYASPSIGALSNSLSSNFNGGISLHSCDELGWRSNPNNVYACGASKFFNESESGSGKCYKGGTSHADALQICRAEGARLCTVAELADDVARNTGCKLEGAVVWTGDQCFGGFMVAGGSSDKHRKRGYIVEPTCKPASTKRFSVRCCADTRAAIHAHHVANHEPSGLQTKPCAALTGWKTVAVTGADAKDGSVDVLCGASKVTKNKKGEAACPKNNGALDYPTAAAICTNAGGMLCSVHELTELNLAQKTGCRTGRELVWTRNECTLNDGGGSYSGMVVAGGSSASKDEPFCASTTRRHFSVVCCASSVSVPIL